ncbi:hypothetical protein F2Q70_00026033 [Brassica cretica]|uniref:Uncharacterized protein n=1 Tax=Brassica cretica TaxID=69181 RepID=A0A8S9LE91_BRACR|nr:hypothetical protein F2Q70_00026033 [Brassica cretica]
MSRSLRCDRPSLSVDRYVATDPQRVSLYVATDPASRSVATDLQRVVRYIATDPASWSVATIGVEGTRGKRKLKDAQEA